MSKTDDAESIFPAMVAAVLACVLVGGIHLALATLYPIGGTP